MIPQYFMKKSQSRSAQLLKTVIFFGLVGPLICSAVFILIGFASAIASVTKAQDLLQRLSDIISSTFALMLFSPVSYVFGLIPALAAGFLVAITRVFFGQVFWPMVIVIGFVVGFVDMYLGGPVRVFFVSGKALGLKLDWWTTGAIALIYVMPTMFCWWIEQRFLPTLSTEDEVFS
ncbi:MAG: hypothetical protein AB7U74_07250 [Afipia sp.]